MRHHGGRLVRADKMGGMRMLDDRPNNRRTKTKTKIKRKQNKGLAWSMGPKNRAATIFWPSG